MQLDSSLLAASFSPSGLGMDKKCPYLGCLWGAWMVSVGCLDGLGVIWDTSMGDKIVILNEKVQSLSYNSHTTFSPSAHFLAKIGQKWRIFRPLLRGVKRHFWSKSTYSPGFIHKTAPKNAWERSTLNQSPPYTKRRSHKAVKYLNNLEISTFVHFHQNVKLYLRSILNSAKRPTGYISFLPSIFITFSRERLKKT